MHNRVPTRVRRTFDTRKDTIADRAGGTSLPITPDHAPKRPTWEREPASAVGVSSQALRVLIVDNDMRAADCLELLLHAGGYPETRVAYTAHGALAIAKEFCPAVALIELDLRDMGSYELGQTLRERAQLQRLRLIAVTDSRAHQGRDSARDAGFERYLLKPITATDLSRLLATPVAP